MRLITRRGLLVGAGGIITAPYVLKRAAAQVGLPFPGPGTVHSGAGGGPYVFITSAKSTTFGADNTTSASFNSTGGDLIVVAVSAFPASTTVPTGVIDSKGNTYTALTAQTQGNQYARLFYTQAPTVGSGHTVSTVGGVGDFPALSLVVLSGSIASPFDVQNGTGEVANTQIQTGSVTPSVNNSLLVTGVSFGDPSTPAIDSSFIIPANGTSDFVGGTHEGVSIAYKIQGTAGAENALWTGFGAANNLAARIATFKP